MDGSSTENSSGAGIVLITPEGEDLHFAVRFKFPASNNVAEYEALIIGMEMAMKAGSEEVSSIFRL